LQAPARLLVNGRSLSVRAEPRTFAAIRRRWNNNDALQLTLPFSFRTEAIDEQHLETAALMHGPLMMVALDRPLTLDKSMINSPQGLKKVPNVAGTFELTTPPEKRRFVPFYGIGEENYTTYLQQA
jgi:hypothetical protein